MKTFISLTLGILCIIQLSAQEHYYYYKGEKVYLELNTDYVFISSTGKNNIKNARINVSVDNNNSTKITEDRASRIFSKPIGFVEKHPLRYYRELNLTDNFSQTKYLTEIQQLRQENSNLIVSPCFQNKSIDKIGLSNYFYVKLKHQNDFSILLEQITKHNVELVGYNKFMPLWFTLSVTPTTPNAMQMANLFYETGLFEHTEPDLMVKVLLSNESLSNSPPTPNDPYYEHQWHLKNTGQYGGIVGLDINAEQAWDVTLGSSDIKVAIVDQGFEMDHPDLDDNTFGTGYDTETESSPSVVRGPHGTPCAGIVGAEANNNEGVSGVAPNTSLISISNAISEASSATVVQQELANGINWAWQNGADIISNSWVRQDLASTIMDEAITNALTKGRGGLGTVVVFAAGNCGFDENEIDIFYPADSNPDILVVGAMNFCGERKNFYSCDDVQLWASCYGDELDVVAPGIFITTTDRQGSNGYNSQNLDLGLDYTDIFDKTSSACPMVAGVAALVLSVNPSLTVQEVNDIIEQSAQKVGDYSYVDTSGRPNGDWNNEMGYGLVDAHAAVTLAQSYCTTDLTFNGSINSGTYEVSNTINATGNIGNAQSVTFNAGRSICLNDVFTADASNGSTFLAQIEGCSVTEGRVSTDNSIVYVMENVEKRPAIDEVVISKNIPNPFTSKTTIEFTLKEDSPVTLSVFDVNGQQIAVLLSNKQQSVGTHQVTFDGNDYPAGMYYYTIQAGEYVGTQKMTLVKP